VRFRPAGQSGSSRPRDRDGRLRRSTLVGHLIFGRRVLRARNIARISTLLGVAALSPVIVVLPVLVALASVTAVLATLVVFERVHFAELRQQYRHA